MAGGGAGGTKSVDSIEVVGVKRAMRRAPGLELGLGLGLGGAG